LTANTDEITGLLSLPPTFLAGFDSVRHLPRQSQDDALHTITQFEMYGLVDSAL